MQTETHNIPEIASWKDLTKLSLLGLSRSPRPVVNHPQIKTLFDQERPDTSIKKDTSTTKELNTTISTEQQVLNFISALSLYEQAGVLAQAKESLGQINYYEQAPQEKRSVIHQLKLDDLESLKHTPVLLLKYLKVIEQAQVLIPPSIIPKLLNLGIELSSNMGLKLTKKESSIDLSAGYDQLKACIINIVGERGQWLIKLNPHWQQHYAINLNDRQEELLVLWKHGNEAERKIYLKRLRSLNPDLARQALVNDFSQERAQMRQSLLSVFKVNLGPNDEEFLESCLDDRSASVKQQAASLLVQLPTSALLTRLSQSLANYINLAPLLKKWKEAGLYYKAPNKDSSNQELTNQESLLTITLPKVALSAVEVRDCIGAINTFGQEHIKGGQRINLLAAFIRCVPLSWWTEQLEQELAHKAPTEEVLRNYLQSLLFEMRKHDHAEALLSALMQAYIHQTHIGHKLSDDGSLGDGSLGSNSELYELWGQALLGELKYSKVGVSHLFYDSLPPQIAKAELLSRIAQQKRDHDNSDYLVLVMTCVDEAEWTPEFSLLIMQMITGELSQIKKGKYAKYLDAAICHIGLYADLSVQPLVDQEWRAYQDRCDDELLYCLDLCQQRFRLRVKLQQQTHGLVKPE